MFLMELNPEYSLYLFIWPSAQLNISECAFRYIQIKTVDNMIKPAMAAAVKAETDLFRAYSADTYMSTGIIKSQFI